MLGILKNQRLIRYDPCPQKVKQGKKHSDNEYIFILKDK